MSRTISKYSWYNVQCYVIFPPQIYLDCYVRFFQSLDWASLDKKKFVPPIVPNVMVENDTRNYILYNGNIAITAEAISEEKLRLFHDF